MHIVCTDNYGLTEVMGPGVSGECLAERFQQHIAEDHFLWEVVDPQTGEPVADGEMGELVLTPLDKQAIPVECLAERFQQHIAEDHFLWEVVDPQTGEPVADGEMGELVLTPLDKQAIPVLRYRTHDLTRVFTERCACGRTHARMQKVRSRCDDMLIIRGTNVFPSQVEDVLAGIEEVSTHYHIVVETVNGMDSMTVEVELRPEAFSDSFEKMNALRRRIADKLKGVLLVGVGWIR